MQHVRLEDLRHHIIYITTIMFVTKMIIFIRTRNESELYENPFELMYEN